MCVYTRIEQVFDCSELTFNRVLCMYHSLGSSLRRDTSVGREMTHCHQATDLKIWSVPSGLLFLFLFLTCLASLVGLATLGVSRLHLIISSVGCSSMKTGHKSVNYLCLMETKLHAARVHWDGGIKADLKATSDSECCHFSFFFSYLKI